MSENISPLDAKLRSGARMLLVEVTPPKGGDPAPLRVTAKRFAGKVDGAGVSDSRYGACMAALAAAGILAGEGVDPILHVVTRDRNRLGLIGTCLGAQALGIRNILCTSGTHQTLGICPAAKNVFDIDSIQLLETIAKLGQGSAAYPGRFEDAGPFCLGAVAAPFADPVELQQMRLAKKIAAGARFLITQPVYDLERFRTWWEHVTRQGLQDKAAIVAGIRPLPDADMARAYAESRPSPRVPAAVLARLSAAGDKAQQRAVGIEIALDAIRQISAMEGVRGFHIDAEGDEDAALDIITRAGLEAR